VFQLLTFRPRSIEKIAQSRTPSRAVWKTDPSELGAVRYFAAIERAYTRALRADAGYAGLVRHNLFSPSYDVQRSR
jgi:hypothetical protein